MSANADLPREIVIDAPWGSRQQGWYCVGAVFAVLHLDGLWEVVQVAATDDGRTRLTIKPHAQDSTA